MRHRLFFGAVLFLMGVVAFADVSVEAGVDRQTLHVGDPVSYTLTITYDPSDSVADIPTGLNLSSLTVRDFSLKRGVPTGDGRLSDVALYVVTVFRLGRFVIPPIPVEYVTADGQVGELVTAPIELTVESLGVAADDSLRGIKPPVTAKEQIQPWVWALVAALLVAGVVAGIILWRRSGDEEVAPAEYIELDWHAELSAIASMDLLSQGEVRFHYDKVSSIFRLFLGRSFRCDVMEMTTSEVNLALSSVNVDGGLLEAILVILSECDLVKFAKHEPISGDAATLIDRVRVVIDTAQPKPTIKDEAADVVDEPEVVGA